jgi:protein involved in sex pheromone biosynthesis
LKVLITFITLRKCRLGFETSYFKTANSAKKSLAELIITETPLMLIFYKIVNAYSGSRAEYLLTKAIKTKTHYMREVESAMTNVSVNFFSTPS